MSLWGVRQGSDLGRRGRGFMEGYLLGNVGARSHDVLASLWLGFGPASYMGVGSMVTVIYVVRCRVVFLLDCKTAWNPLFRREEVKIGLCYNMSCFTWWRTHGMV